MTELSKSSLEKDERIFLGELKCVGFFRRFLAYAIDSFVFILLCSLLVIIFSTLYYLIAGESLNISWMTSKNGVEERILFSSFFQLLWLVIVSVFLSSKWQATPGKRIMKIYVVDLEKQKIPLWKAILRTFLPMLIYLLISSQFLRIESNMWLKFDIEAKEVIRVYAPFYKPLLSKDTVGFYDYLHSKEGSDKLNRLERIIPMAQWQMLDFEIKYLKNGVPKQYLIEYVLWILAWIVIMLYWYGRINFSYQRSAVHDSLVGTRVVVGKIS